MNKPYQSNEEIFYNQRVGNKIYIARMECGLTQSFIAKAIGCTFQQIQKYENGVNRLTPYRIATIARITGKNIGYFFDDIPVDSAIAQSSSRTIITLMHKFSRLTSKAQTVLLKLIDHMEQDTHE